MKYPVGTRIQGKVRNLTSFGAFVEIEPGIDGLIHISDMSWTKRVQHPSEVVKKGDAVNVVILNIDGENKRISLGLKQAEEDPWLRIGETFPVGTEIRGRVVRLMDKGVVVDLGNDIEGFVPDVPARRRQTSRTRPTRSRKASRWTSKVIEVDPIHHRIVLAVVGFPVSRADPPAGQALFEEAARSTRPAADAGEAVSAKAAPDAVPSAEACLRRRPTPRRRSQVRSRTGGGAPVYRGPLAFSPRRCGGHGGSTAIRTIRASWESHVRTIQRTRRIPRRSVGHRLKLIRRPSGSPLRRGGQHLCGMAQGRLYDLSPVTTRQRPGSIRKAPVSRPCKRVRLTLSARTIRPATRAHRTSTPRSDALRGA